MNQVIKNAIDKAKFEVKTSAYINGCIYLLGEKVLEKVETLIEGQENYHADIAGNKRPYNKIPSLFTEDTKAEITVSDIKTWIKRITAAMKAFENQQPEMVLRKQAEYILAEFKDKRRYINVKLEGNINVEEVKNLNSNNFVEFLKMLKAKTAKLEITANFVKTGNLLSVK